MQPSFRRACAALLIALAGGPVLAFTPADYSASFQLTSGNLAVLKTGVPVFDGDRHFTGAWTDFGLQDARTLTTDLASFSTGADGQSFIPTWGTSGYDENRGRGGQGPHRFGESFAYTCGLPGGCATGTHTASTAWVFGESMGAEVSLTDLYAKTEHPFLEALQLTGIAEENLQARVRGVIWMAVSNQEGPLVLANSNKSEVSVGYSTIYGDSVGGFAPIKDVPKTLAGSTRAWTSPGTSSATPGTSVRSIRVPGTPSVAASKVSAATLPTTTPSYLTSEPTTSEPPAVSTSAAASHSSANTPCP